MARATLADIIDFVRGLIGDPDAAAYSDNDIQAQLDLYAQTWVEVELHGESNRSNERLYFFGPEFAEDATLLDADLAELTPASADDLTGKYVMSTDTATVYLTATVHDAYTVAADLLERKLISGGSEYVDVSTGRHRIAGSQHAAMIRDQIREYRSRSPRGQGVMSLRRWDFRA